MYKQHIMFVIRQVRAGRVQIKANYETKSDKWSIICHIKSP